MTAHDRLERTYRLLLRSFPASYRAEREDELVAVLMAGAADGQTRPDLLESLGLVRLGAASRLRRILAPGREPRVALALSVVLALLGTLLIGSVLQKRGQLGATSPQVHRAHPAHPAAGVVTAARLCDGPPVRAGHRLLLRRLRGRADHGAPRSWRLHPSHGAPRQEPGLPVPFRPAQPRRPFPRPGGIGEERSPGARD